MKKKVLWRYRPHGAKNWALWVVDGTTTLHWHCMSYGVWGTLNRNERAQETKKVRRGTWVCLRASNAKSTWLPLTIPDGYVAHVRHAGFMQLPLYRLIASQCGVLNRVLSGNRWRTERSLWWPSPGKATLLSHLKQVSRLECREEFFLNLATCNSSSVFPLMTVADCFLLVWKESYHRDYAMN